MTLEWRNDLRDCNLTTALHRNLLNGQLGCKGYLRPVSATVTAIANLVDYINYCVTHQKIVIGLAYCKAAAIFWFYNVATALALT